MPETDNTLFVACSEPVFGLGFELVERGESAACERLISYKFDELGFPVGRWGGAGEGEEEGVGLVGGEGDEVEGRRGDEEGGGGRAELVEY